jgi:hypothetical protein
MTLFEVMCMYRRVVEGGGGGEGSFIYVPRVSIVSCVSLVLVNCSCAVDCVVMVCVWDISS